MLLLFPIRSRRQKKLFFTKRNFCAFKKKMVEISKSTVWGIKKNVNNRVFQEKKSKTDVYREQFKLKSIINDSKLTIRISTCNWKLESLN